jgi:hypothetical protein
MYYVLLTFFLGISNLAITLDKNNLKHEIRINIINDNIIEPFEFFTLIVEPNSVNPPEYFTLQKKIVYIEDDDCMNIIFYKKVFLN